MVHRANEIRTCVLAAVLACATLGAAAPARAQFYGGYDEEAPYLLGPGQVRDALERRGFRVLAPPRRNDRVYVVDAVGPRGRHVRLIVDATDGRVLQRFLEDGGDGGFAPGRGAEVDEPPEGRGAPRTGGRGPEVWYGDGGSRGGGTDRGRSLYPDRDGVTPREGAGRAVPPIRTVRPAVGTEERTMRDEGAPRPTRPAPVTESHPIVPSPRQEPPRAAAPVVTGAGDVTAPHRPSNPLAIPGGPEPGHVRNVSPGVTGAPVPQAPSHGGSGVPAAPLD